MSKAIDLTAKLGGALQQPDRQTNALKSVEQTDAAFLERLRECFEGHDLAQNEKKIREAARLSNALQRGKAKFLDNAIEMGRAILRAEKAFSRDEWRQFVENSPYLVGLKKSMLSKLRAVSQAVDSGKIDRKTCPNSFTTAYTIARLPDEKLAEVKRRGLLNPQMTRQELQSVIKENKQHSETDADILDRLTKRRERLYNELERVEAEISKIMKR